MKVSEDENTTEVGAGNRWVDVHGILGKRNFSVVGGIVADIGVGGLTLGEGISFFSASYGWACDNVVSYKVLTLEVLLDIAIQAHLDIDNRQVVPANGSVHKVTHQIYPDLYFALRGGGSNFGIVTIFTLLTFPQGPLWTSSQTYIYSPSTADSLNNAV